MFPLILCKGNSEAPLINTSCVVQKEANENASHPMTNGTARNRENHIFRVVGILRRVLDKWDGTPWCSIPFI